MYLKEKGTKKYILMSNKITVYIIIWLSNIHQQSVEQDKLQQYLFQLAYVNKTTKSFGF